MNSLTQQLTTLQEQLASQLPSSITAAFEASILELQSLSLEQQSLQVGDKFPDFSLVNTGSTLTVLGELLDKGQVLIAFFRGSWCPYCNLELKALQECLAAFSENTCTLLAISPQAIEHNADLKKSQALDYELLQDKDNALAKQLGISFALSEELHTIYRSLGIDLALFNMNNAQELPIPAIYLLGKDQLIRYRYVNSNYMQRVNLEELKNAVCQP